MYALSKFSFIQNYNKEKFTKQEASEKGLAGTVIEKCDKNGDGEVSIDEILGNSEACDKILDNIKSEHEKVVNAIKELTAKKIKEDKAEKTEKEQVDKGFERRPFANDFKDIFKRPNRFGDNFKFNIAA